jgi:predicted ester cyclase
MSVTTNKDVIERFDALLTTHELDQLEVLCTPDMVNHALAPGRPPGLAGSREFLETTGRRQFADQAWHELTVVAEGDYVVQFGVRGGQWPGGEFLGVQAAPGAYARDFAAMYRFRDGRIAERWAVRDDLGMLRQLGALPRP